MNGKRILDAAAIFQASRGIAAKHVALRKHQLDAYSKTSSLAKAVKSQTDRVILTVKAASALADTLNGPGPAYSTQASSSDKSTKDESIPSKSSVEGGNASGEQKQGLAQDHFYEKSDINATTEQLPDGELDIKQEKAKRYPLPDGTVPPKGFMTNASRREKDSYSELPHTEPVKGPLEDSKGRTGEDIHPAASVRTSIPDPRASAKPASGDHIKKLQRQAETQIPSQAAEPPPAVAYEPEAEGLGLKVNQEQDVFYTPSPSVGKLRSSLPRVKLPKNTEDTQESDEHVPDTEMNQDVFYSSTRKDQGQTIPEGQAVPEQEQFSDEAYSEIFRSPKVADMLSGQPKKSNSSKGLDLPGVKDLPVMEFKSPQQKDQVSSSMRLPVQEDSQTSGTNQDGDEDVHKLAADITKDAESMPPDKLEVSF